MSAPATSYNLADWARGVINAGDVANGYGSARVLVVGDSLSTPQTGVPGRLPAGIANMWRPYRWSGWYAETASVNQNHTASPNNPGWIVSPFNGAVSGVGFNGYAFVGAASGAQFQTVTGGNDTSAGVPTALNTVNSDPRPGAYTFSPHAYRDIVLQGSVAANTDLFQFVQDWRTWARFESISEPGTSATTFGSWICKGDVVRGRLIYWQNPDGPTDLRWRAYRNNTGGSETTLNASGSARLNWVDVDFAASTSHDGNQILRPRIRSGGSVVDYTASNKIVPVVGVRYFRPNNPGLEVSFWTQPGWNTEMFNGTSGGSGTDTINDTDLGYWLQALDWPTHVMVFLGQNQSSTQQTELNAGTTATFKSDYRTLVSRILARYAANGVPAPKMLYIAPPTTTRARVVASGRTDQNFPTLERAIYELAVEHGASFFSLLKTDIAVMDRSDDATGNGTGANNGQVAYSADEVHQVHAGSAIWAGAIHAAMRVSLDTENAGSTGRQWRVR